MTNINSAVSHWSLPQSQLRPEPVNKPSAGNAASSMAGSSESAEKNTDRETASIKHKKFLAEDVSIKRVPRALGKLFANTGLDFSGSVKVPEGVKVPERVKAPEDVNVPVAGTSRPLGSGSSKFDKDFVAEQSNLKAKDDYAKKLGQEVTTEVAPSTSKLTLEVPDLLVNGKAVDEFSSVNLGRSGDALDEAVSASDVNLEPVKYKLSDTKKALLTAGTVAGVTAVSTTINEGVKKAFMDSPGSIFEKGLAETRVVDQLQDDVFKAANMLKRFKDEDEVKPDFQWALKSNEERMTSLESITIALEKDFGKLADHYGIPFTFSASRNEDPDIAVRGKVIETKLAVITSIANEVALKIKAAA